MSASSEKSAGAPATAPVECRKKKSEVDEGYIKDMINHIDEFVNASYDEHKSCLQKTIRKLFGTTREVATPAPTSSAQQSAPPSTPTPVVSALPLRVKTG